MTPLEIEICLWYHARVEEAPWVLNDAPIKDHVMSGLVAKGLLNFDNSPAKNLATKTSNTPVRMYSPTPKLHAFVEMLCATPLPEQRFVDPRFPVTECNDAHWAADLTAPSALMDALEFNREVKESGRPKFPKDMGSV